MRLQSLSIRSKPNEQPEESTAFNDQALRAWYRETKDQRPEGWNWTTISDELVFGAVQALAQDFATDTLGISKLVTSLLYDLPEGEQTWGWTIPLTNGAHIHFVTALKHETPDPDSAAVSLELVADDDEDRERLKSMGAYNETTTIDRSTMSELLDEASERTTPDSALKGLTLSDWDVATAAAEVRRAEAQWPDEHPIFVLMMVAGPAALWTRGVAMNATTTEFTLSGLTHDGVEQEEDLQAIITVNHETVKPTARTRPTF